MLWFQARFTKISRAEYHSRDIRIEESSKSRFYISTRPFPQNTCRSKYSYKPYYKIFLLIGLPVHVQISLCIGCCCCCCFRISYATMQIGFHTLFGIAFNTQYLFSTAGNRGRGARDFHRDFVIPHTKKPLFPHNATSFSRFLLTISPGLWDGS